MQAGKSQFERHNWEVLAEWQNFRDNITPQADDAERFLQDHGMHIPFGMELFGGAVTDRI